MTKNLPEFKFASEDWAVWEWISPETSPQYRQGITYEKLAEKEGLTKLNHLNRSNYNPHDMRLDIGGIQQEYLGRRFNDFIKGFIFYLRKINREGFSSLMPYLTKDNLVYVFRRLVALIGSTYHDS